MKKIFTYWMAPLLISAGLFLLVQPTFAQIAEDNTGAGQTVNNVDVGVENFEGITQVYYMLDGEKIFVSEDRQNKRHPHSVGEYIVWVGDINGAGQIYRYHIPTNTIVQITRSGTNLLPKVSSNGEVVWEGWINEEGGKWQVFLFDGTKTVQLTQGDESRHPDINGDHIAYARHDISGTWRSVVYSISKNEAKEVATGIASKKPLVRDGRIILAGRGVHEEFALTVDDLFLLDLAPLTATSSATPTQTQQVDAPETVTQDEVAEELNDPSPATESAIIE